MSDVIVVMRDGRIQQQGAPEELYQRPVNRFVAGFIGSSNFIDAHVVEHDRASRTAKVETPGGLTLVGPVTDPEAGLAAGAPVTVAIRPEGFRVEPSEGDGAVTGAGWTATAGRISQGTYLGDQTEYRIDTEAIGELVVRRQNEIAGEHLRGFGPGEPVVVKWQQEANLILAS